MSYSRSSCASLFGTEKSMQEERSKLLAQVPLYVSPYINLPKTPTLPHNYTSLPSTIPPSILSKTPLQPGSSIQSSQANDSLPAYVTSPQSTFAAHPSSIIAQNRALLEELRNAPIEAEAKVEAWTRAIEDRELQEKRRRAPGWLDRDEKILNPLKAADTTDEGEDAGPLSGSSRESAPQVEGNTELKKTKSQEGELGDLMDRAFGGMR